MEPALSKQWLGNFELWDKTLTCYNGGFISLVFDGYKPKQAAILWEP